MAKQASELSYAVRLRVVLKYFGQLCFVLAALTLVPLGVALAFGEIHISLRYAVVLCVLIAFGAMLTRGRAPLRIQTNEAMVLTALIFLFTPLVMSYPMMGSGLSFMDAFFEAISAGTTTGLSTTITVENKPSSFLFARAWMQWYGGLGIVVLSVALVIQPGLAAKQLAVTEGYKDDLIGGTKAHARRVLLVYCILTGIGVACLWLLSGNLFNAVLYALAAISTGGFAPHDASLAGFGDWPVQWMVILICLLGAVSLAFYPRVFRKGWRLILKDVQLQGFLVVAVAAVTLLAVCMRMVHDVPWSQTLYHAPLLALSAQTTAGFSTTDLSGLDAASKIVLILSMAIGGGIGSTAGGFKILRLMILIRLLQATIVRTCLPTHAVFRPFLGGHPLEDFEIKEALSIILLFVMVIIVSWLVFVATGYDPVDSLFEVVSATGTVGLSAGVTGPDLPAFLKGVLCVDMLMGRLEIVAWLVILFPRTWFGRRAEAS